MGSTAYDISTYLVDQLGTAFTAGGVEWGVFKNPQNEQAAYAWWATEQLEELDLGTKEEPIYTFEVEFTIVQQVGQYNNTAAIEAPWHTLAEQWHHVT